MSARGWLSTWSGPLSNAALERTMPGVAVPTLVDLRDGRSRHLSERVPPELRCGAARRTSRWAELAWAGHYLYPVGPEGARLPHPQERVADEVILPWLRQRWPA